MKNKILISALAFILLVNMFCFVSAIPTFTLNTQNPVSNSRYSPNQVYTFTINITNGNGTAGIEFNGVNHSLTNLSTIYTYSATDLQAGNYNYHWWANNNTAFNSSSVYSYVIQDQFTQQGTYDIMRSSGAGLGIFLLYMAKALPYLLIGLTMIGIIVTIGYMIISIFKPTNLSKGLLFKK